MNSITATCTFVGFTELYLSSRFRFHLQDTLAAESAFLVSRTRAQSERLQVDDDLMEKPHRSAYHVNRPIANPSGSLQVTCMRFQFGLLLNNICLFLSATLLLSSSIN